jgi:hypothetical protein
VSNGLAVIANGPVTTAYASRTPSNCTYSKSGVSVYCFFHWSCSSQSIEKSYRFDGRWVFPIKVGPNNGVATLDWQFNYIIFMSPTA